MANTNLFRTFIVVAETGSITKASERLYISQPALTKEIKQLEEELGTADSKRVLFLSYNNIAGIYEKLGGRENLEREIGRAHV